MGEFAVARLSQRRQTSRGAHPAEVDESRAADPLALDA